LDGRRRRPSPRRTRNLRPLVSAAREGSVIRHVAGRSVRRPADVL